MQNAKNKLANTRATQILSVRGGGGAEEGGGGGVAFWCAVTGNENTPPPSPHHPAIDSHPNVPMAKKAQSRGGGGGGRGGGLRVRKQTKLPAKLIPGINYNAAAAGQG